MLIRGHMLGVALCALLGLGCASAAPRPASAPAASSAEPPPSAPDHAAPASPGIVRELSAQATFSDLVRLARSLGSSREATSDAGCLLGRPASAPSAFALLADLMPSIEGMPDPPSDLAARMREHGGAVAMLTAWGTAGDVRGELVFAGFTTVPPAASAAPFVVLALSEDEAFVRRSDAPSSADATELSITAAVAQAQALLSNAPGVLYVTASASTKLSALRSALELLGNTTPVALAVLLPEGTTLRAGRDAAATSELCPGGLPEPAASETDFGDLSREAVRPAVDRLREEIAPCLRSLRSERARVVVALRIDADGTVQQACALDAGGIDPVTLSCVLMSARALRTPPPSPRGIVDLHLPLALQAVGPSAQRPLCN